MFTSEAQSIIDLGKDIATTRREAKLQLEAIATALAMNRRGAVLLAACLESDADALNRRFPSVDNMQRCSGKLPLADECREMLRLSKSLVEKIPSASQPALVALPHLACALALSLTADQGTKAASEGKILKLLAQWIEEDGRPASLGRLTQRVRALRQ